MHPLITQFLSKATVVTLKKKLSILGHVTTGNKSELILRVEEVTQDMENDEIERHFGTGISVEPGTSAESIPNDESDNEDEDDDNDQLDHELNSLREKLKKKKDIIELKKQLAELKDTLEVSSSTSFFNFRDIEESLNSFSGDNNYDVKKWIQEVEDAAEVLGWNEKACFIYARRLLTGTAKLYLRTVSVKTWKDLKTMLVQEFDRKISCAEVHDELRRRKKKNGETWQQYIFAMQEIGFAAKVDESDLIQYIIDGINDSNVNKMILYNAIVKVIK